MRKLLTRQKEANLHNKQEDASLSSLAMDNKKSLVRYPRHDKNLFGGSAVDFLEGLSACHHSQTPLQICSRTCEMGVAQRMLGHLSVTVLYNCDRYSLCDSCSLGFAHLCAPKQPSGENRRRSLSSLLDEARARRRQRQRGGGRTQSKRSHRTRLQESNKVKAYKLGSGTLSLLSKGLG